MKKTVALVEDDARLRKQLVQILEDIDDIECVIVCASAEEALEKIPSKNPDVVLMDIKLPRMSGIQCVAELKRILPEVQVIMVTVYEDSERIFKALKAGASGYILKKHGSQKIIEALKELYNGGSPMSADIARKVVRAFHQEDTPQDYKLTKRELDILQLLAKGMLYKEISQQLFISNNTVKQHIHNIYEKLQVHSVVEAVTKAIAHKIV